VKFLKAKYEEIHQLWHKEHQDKTKLEQVVE
jgi:hypothetical protein